MELTFDTVKELILKENGKPYKLSSSNIYTENVLDWIISNIEGTDDIGGKIWCIVNNMKESPRCKTCNQYTRYGGSINKGFMKFCSSPLCRSSHKDTREKYCNTSIKNYGVDNPLKNVEHRELIQNIMLEKYGSKFAMQSNICKGHYEHTSLENWGFTNPLKSEAIQTKIQSTFYTRYGCKVPSQNSEFLRRIMDSKLIRTLNYKETKLYYQSSYEYYFLELLENAELLHLVENGLSFKYTYLDDRERLYVSDFFIKDLNLIIEIKSKWTFNRNDKDRVLESQNLKKQETVLSLGFDFKFLIDKPKIKEFVNALNNEYIKK